MGNAECVYQSMVEFYKILDYDKVLLSVSSYAVSDIAKDCILKLEPFHTLSEVENVLDTVLEARSASCPIQPFCDVTIILQRTKIGAVLSLVELFALYQLLHCTKNCKKQLQDTEHTPKLAQLASELDGLESLYTLLTNTMDEYGNLRDEASPALKQIRKSLRYQNQQLKTKLATFSQKGEHSKYLQDDIITTRNGRFVLPVKAENKSQIEGLLHDRSASGSTLYIEPAEVVGLNNELRRLEVEESHEIQKILQATSLFVAQHIAPLYQNLSLCVQLDTLFARAEYARTTQGVRPLTNNQGKFCIKQARHPLLDSQKMVPLDIEMVDKRMLLISGPNMGGKTVTLKTMGLFSLMTASGIFVPCYENSEIPIFDNIFVCIGDNQSIEHSYSTFSSHILAIKDILSLSTQNSLVLIDELGTGTDPEEGAAIAMALLDHLLLLGCVSAVTSHFGKVKDYGIQNPNIESASMHFDTNNLQPTYRLVMGVAGASNAIAICQKLGLDAHILRSATKNLSKEHTEYNTLLAKTQDTYAQLAMQLQQATQNNLAWQHKIQEVHQEKENLLSKQNKVVANAKKETDRLIAGAQSQATDLIEQIKEKLMESDEAALLQAKQLATKLSSIDRPHTKNTIQYQSFETAPQKGDKVIVKSIGSTGTIKETDSKGNYLVTVGVATIKCALDNLAPLQVTPPTATPKPSKKIKDIEGAVANNQQAEIKVLGQTVAEALSNIDPFLENCHISGVKVVRIVHGKGSGALGKGIHQYLKTLKFVQSYRYGGYGEGEKGVTIIELK